MRRILERTPRILLFIYSVAVKQRKDSEKSGVKRMNFSRSNRDRLRVKTSLLFLRNFSFQRNAVKFVGIGVFGLSSNAARPENLWMKMKKLQEYNALNNNASTRWKYWFKENVLSRVSWFLEFKWCFMYFISWIACSSAGYHRRTHIKHLNSLQFNLFKLNAVPSIE